MGESDPNTRREYPPEPPRVNPRYSVEQLICTLDELGRKHYRTPEGRPACGRLKNRHNRKVEREACLAPPMASGACRAHGGASPGAPHSAGGRYSQYLTRWRSRYEQALNDKALLDVRPDIALLDAAIGDLVTRSQELDCPGWRQELRAAFDELNGAIRAGRQRAVGPALKRLEELIQRGAEADRVASELTAAVDKRAERAAKTLALKIRAEEKVTTHELLIVFGSWVEVLKTHLDELTFRKLLPYLRELTSSHELPVPGSLEAIDQEEVAAERLVELDEGDQDDGAAA